MKHFYVICVVLLASVIFSPALLRAQAPSGEIININYRYQIAFADLTEQDVAVGDVLSVSLADGNTASVQVVEAYAVMVKLSPAKTDPQAAGAFGKIVVGNRVTRATALKTPTPSLQDAAPATDVMSNASIEVYRPQPVEIAVPATQTPMIEQNASAPVADVCRSSCGEEQKKIEELTRNNLELSGHISKALSEKDALSTSLAQTTLQLEASQKKVQDLIAEAQGATSRIQAFEKEKTTVVAERDAARKQAAELQAKVDELKKKLAAMAQRLTQYIKSYE